MVDFDKMTRRFLMGEGKDLSIGSYLRALQEGLCSIRPASQSQAIVVENMKSHLRSIKKEVQVLQEKVGILEQRLHTIDEEK